jgi:hypothetical protein
MSNRLKSFLIAFVIVVILLLLSGCSASWHVRKAQKKDPSLFVRDTVTTVDTVWIEVSKVDTLFKYQFDTVEFWKDSVFVKYFYQPIDSTVYIEVDCPDQQTITKTNTVTEIITLKPTLVQYLKAFIISLVVLAAIFFISKLLT